MKKIMILSITTFFIVLLIFFCTKEAGSMVEGRNGEQFLFGAVNIPDGGVIKINVSNTADEDSGENCMANIMIYDMDGIIVHEREFSIRSKTSISTAFTPDDDMLLRPEVKCFGKKFVCSCTSLIETLLDVEIPDLLMQHINPQLIRIIIPKPTPTPTPRGGGGGG